MSRADMAVLIILSALLVALFVRWRVVVRDRREVERAARLDAAVRAQQIVELIPERGVTVRGASRDRSRPGKQRRRARRV